MVRGCQEGKKDNASDRHISPHEEPVFLSLMAALQNQSWDIRKQGVVSLAHLLSLPFLLCPTGRLGGPSSVCWGGPGHCLLWMVQCKSPAVFTRISH